MIVLLGGRIPVSAISWTTDMNISPLYPDDRAPGWHIKLVTGRPGSPGRPASMNKNRSEVIGCGAGRGNRLNSSGDRLTPSYVVRTPAGLRLDFACNSSELGWKSYMLRPCRARLVWKSMEGVGPQEQGDIHILK